jgi:hypothetical protein
MLGALIRIVSGISNQIADDQAIKRDLIRMKEGYTGVRITGDEAAREEAVKQFMNRYQKPNPPAETNNSPDEKRPSQHPS